MAGLTRYWNVISKFCVVVVKSVPVFLPSGYSLCPLTFKVFFFFVIDNLGLIEINPG